MASSGNSATAGNSVSGLGGGNISGAALWNGNVTGNNNMKLMGDLYALDPSTRIDLPLTADDDRDAQSIASKIHQVLADDLFLIRVRHFAWELFRDKKIADRTEINTAVATLLEDSGLKDTIANSTVRILEKAAANTRISDQDSRFKLARTSADEQIACIREARENWEIGVNEELLAVVAESRRDFLILRPPGAVNRKLEHVAEESPAAAAVATNTALGSLSTTGETIAVAAGAPIPTSATTQITIQPSPAITVAHLEDVRFLYDSDDLFEALAAIRNPNMKQQYEDRIIGQIKLNIRTPNTTELCNLFPELNPTVTQIGIDDKSSTIGSKFCFIRHEEADIMCANGCCPIIEARKYLRRGCLPAYRAKLYRAALQLPEDVCVSEQVVFAQLRMECDRIDLLTDDLYLHDVQNIIDDTRFFVFEEELKQIALCFSRDEWVRHNSLYSIHRPLLASSTQAHIPTNALVNEHSTSAPPCGVQPFCGLSTYFAPLCYIYRDVASCYSVCRAMFAHIWCKMNVMSGDEGTLLHVCKTFENLLLSNHSKLVFHLNAIGVQPLQIAMPWMQLGFVNFLEMDQVLMLWDRLLGYNDMLLLAVLAVAVFLVRSENLLQVNSPAEVQKLLSEGSRLKVVPLLQMMLPFADSKVTSLTSAAKHISLNGIAGASITAPSAST